MISVFRPIYRLIRIASGSFFFCTRQAFEAVGGFDEKLFAAEEAALSWTLRGQGRFVLLKESVITSGRKLRTYSIWETLLVLSRLTLGRWGVRNRKGLEIWYGERRKDPGENRNSQPSD